MGKKQSIDNILKNMRMQSKLQNMKGKGDAGEEAVLQIMLQRLQHTGGLLYRSFRYPYQQNRQNVTYVGNIMLEEGKFVAYNDARNGRILEDEIDILYVTPLRIFPIEVKSYHAKLEVYNDWMKKQGEEVDKSPIAQAEKHARHLYHALHDVLPDGRPEYIQPIVCFVDRCTLVDSRNQGSKVYLPCCILNNLKSTIIHCNTPLRYSISVPDVKKKLDSIKTDVLKEYV